MFCTRFSLSLRKHLVEDDMPAKDNTFRLYSLEDPTDEQLQAVMEQVAIAARESTYRAKQEIERRFQEIRNQLQASRLQSVK